MSKHHKNRLPPFVPLLISTIDTEAWRHMSHGVKALYVALKRRVPNAHNRSYLSHRTAAKELKSYHRKVREWFAELEHYGFIALAVPGPWLAWRRWQGQGSPLAAHRKGQREQAHR
jgi:hypothetical protein